MHNLEFEATTVTGVLCFTLAIQACQYCPCELQVVPANSVASKVLCKLTLRSSKLKFCIWVLSLPRPAYMNGRLKTGWLDGVNTCNDTRRFITQPVSTMLAKHTVLTNAAMKTHGKFAKQQIRSGHW